MLRQLRIPLLITLLAPYLLAERPTAAVQESLREARQKLQAGKRAADADQLAQLLVDDCLVLSVYGDTRDKTAYVKRYRREAEGIRSLPAEAEPVEEDVQVRQYGTVAVVTGRQTYVAPIAVVIFTQIWVHEKGVWRLASAHNSIPAARR